MAIKNDKTEEVDEIEEITETEPAKKEPINLMENAPPPTKKPRQAQPFNGLDLSSVTDEIKKIDAKLEKFMKGEEPPVAKPPATKPQEKDLMEILGDW